MKCIGYGPYEGECDNEAGTPWSPYWCPRCNDLRLRTIDEHLQQVVDELNGVKNGGAGK